MSRHKYLSAADLHLIHSVVVDETGGSHGVRDEGLLESALAQPRQSFSGKDLHRSLEEKATSLLLGLLKNHPFVDGNKRTALTAFGVFAALNGRKLVCDQNELAENILTLAAGRADLQAVLPWVKKHLK
jgi:death on curing protein